MAELIEEIDLGDGRSKRIYDDGRTVVFDADGRFSPGGSMTPETARAVAAGRTLRRTEERAENVSELLVELGLPNSRTARRLAEMFWDGGAGAVASFKELYRMGQKDTPGAQYHLDWIGPGAVVIDGVLFQRATIQDLREWAEEARKLGAILESERGTHEDNVSSMSAGDLGERLDLAREEAAERAADYRRPLDE